MTNPAPKSVLIGDLSLTILSGGKLWLDGGAMFGIIPKPMWSKLVEVDEANRIPLETNCVFLETAGKRILVESGVGHRSKFDEKEQGYFRFSDYWLLDSLSALGIDPESIDLVVLTHLHFDHAGGGTIADGSGGYRPTFPRAKYVVQRGEWEDAVSGHAVMTGTYRRENLAPLETAGLLSLVDGEAEIVSGMSVKPMRGHTRHQQAVMFRSGGQTLVQPADLMPTAAHVGVRYNMAYDLMPYENMQNKERLLQDAMHGGWRLLLGQDPKNAPWRVIADAKGRSILEPAV